MKNGQWDDVTKFILTGLFNHPAICFSLFVAFLLIYLIILSGSGLIFTAIGTEAKLHKSMYFFLSNLSLLDICCPTATVPKVQDRELQHNFLHWLLLQLSVLVTVAGTEVFLLTVMTLHSEDGRDMNHWVPRSQLTFSLSFCHSNKVNQYYCDIPLVLDLYWIFSMGAFLVTLFSYIQIISAILKIQSVEGKHKAFSTCTSHLSVVCLFYGMTIVTYICPSSNHSLDWDRLAAVLYGVLTLMLHPIIYMLRNAEVKGALRRVMGCKCH
uniref:G-protein coupled receptors family 1 profile domain-containing protein n=1 Tax=Chelonoidis abingdonii TaxID=106734 RepID=A0A8C0GR46_CHEAB